MRLLYVVEEVPNRSVEHGNGALSIAYEVVTRMAPEVTIDLVTWAVPGCPVPDPVQERCSSVTVLPRRSGLACQVVSKATPLSHGAVERLATGLASRTRAGDHDVTLFHGPHSVPLTVGARGPLAVQLVDPWSMRMTMESIGLSGPQAAWRQLKIRQSAWLEKRLPRRAAVATVGSQDADLLAKALGRPVASIPVS